MIGGWGNLGRLRRNDFFDYPAIIYFRFKIGFKEEIKCALYYLQNRYLEAIIFVLIESRNMEEQSSEKALNEEFKIENPKVAVNLIPRKSFQSGRN